MSRFYFHLRDGESLLDDPEGIELPGLDAARAHALAAARDLLAESLRAGQVLDGQTIEIADEAGSVLETVPLRKALRLP